MVLVFVTSGQGHAGEEPDPWADGTFVHTQNHVCLVPGLGFEPRFEDSKSPVLPLNDPGTDCTTDYGRIPKVYRLLATFPIIADVNFYEVFVFVLAECAHVVASRFRQDFSPINLLGTVGQRRIDGNTYRTLSP